VKLAASETCHVCRRALAGGYKRCYGAEHIVECLKVPCPNEDYGCSVKLALYDASAHLQACQYRPLHCPAEKCTFFTGGLGALLDHFVKKHRWPATDVLIKKHRWPSTDVYDGRTNLALVDGFNVIRLCYPLSEPSVTGIGYTVQILNHLVLLKVTRESYGRVVTPIHIIPRDAKKCQLKLAYETPCGTQHVEYAFNMASTSSGLPSLDDCFEFVIPKSVQPLDVDTIKLAITCSYPVSTNTSPKSWPEVTD